MPALIIALRIVALFAFAGPMLLPGTRRREGSKPRERGSGRERAPVVANFASFVLFLVALVAFQSSVAAPQALLLAASGSLLSVAGAFLVRRSRAELGSAWSLVADADQRTGLVTTGPYEIVRHPIYLGLVLLAMGQAIAFGSWPGLAIVLVGVVPTLAWRARVEERVLRHTFGEPYGEYQGRTRSMIPYLF